MAGPHLLFSFLTPNPNALVAPINSNAMTVITVPQDAAACHGCVDIGKANATPSAS